MPDMITLSCPTCGSKLKVTDQIHLLVCLHCGNEHMVVRDSGTMYLAPLAQDVRQIRVGVDKTAAELAVARLSKEIEQLATAHNTAAAKTPDEWSPPNNLEKFCSKSINPLIVIGVLGVITQKSLAVFIIGVAVVVCFMVHLLLSGNRRYKATKDRANVLAELDASLAIKQEQYRKNRRIAES